MGYGIVALLALITGLSAQEIRLTQIASGIAAPTDIQSANDGSGRMFFVQQNGLVRIFRNGAVAPQPFLDIRSKTTADGERGLLGLAFPPGFAQKQRFYVDFTDRNGDTIIAQYRVSSDADLADAGSEVVLLKIAQPFPNHNGGQVRFGPDGYLYIAMGDGGSGGDPMGNGQNRGALLGKLLRVDVEAEPGSLRVPPDNPFVNVAGARPEVWAYGLRNPWRFAFDHATGDLWIGDVGQDMYEEVDYQPASSRGGENYGWNVMEGAHCYRANCRTEGLTAPVAEYDHSEGCSIIGGLVYRGRSSPGLRGMYLYADLCSGRIWGVNRQGSGWFNRQVLASGLGITTFGEDEAGEVYLAATNGNVYHIEGSRAPVLASAGLVNAASFAPGISPGSLATAFVAGVLDEAGIVMAGSLPLATSLAGVSVSVNGIAAPVHLIANRNGQEQVNFQVPFEVAGNANASIVISRDGRSSAAVNVPVLDVQPAIYTADGSAVVVHNADFTLVNPARPLTRGEFVLLYAAGLGAVRNQPATGAAASTSPAVSGVRVTLGGAACEVQYAGLAPGFVGVYQVNFQVPANAASGSQNLNLSAGDAKSPDAPVAVR